MPGDAAAYHLDLLRQIHDRHVHVGVVVHAADGPPTCVAAHIKQVLGSASKDDL